MTVRGRRFNLSSFSDVVLLLMCVACLVIAAMQHANMNRARTAACTNLGGIVARIDNHNVCVRIDRIELEPG